MIEIVDNADNLMQWLTDLLSNMDPRDANASKNTIGDGVAPGYKLLTLLTVLTLLTP